MLGLVGPSTRDSVATRFQSMLRVMDRGDRLRSETAVASDGRWALGRVHLGVLQPDRQPARVGQVSVLFHGDLANESELRARLAQLGEPPQSGAAAIVAALYRRIGPEIARDLQGAFAAAIVDETSQRLLLVTDRFGSYPVYWFHTPGQLAFAAELRAALKAHPRPGLNARAVSDFMKFGFPMGDKTLAAGVELVPAGAVLSYDWTADAVSVCRHASLASLFRQTDIGRKEYLGGLAESFGRSMTRATAGSHRYGLSLSGGLDTRVLLAALDRRGCSVSSYTLGGRGCADEVIANQLSRMAKTKHRFVALDDQYLDDLLPTVQRMVSLTDGMYLSHGFTEMLALRGFEESDCSVLLRGHAGELAKASTAWPLHTDETIFRMSSTGEFIPYLLSRLTHVSRGDVTREVLADAWVESLDGADARRSLEESLEGVPLSPPDLCSYIYLKEYHRRVTVPSLEIFRNVTEVRLPLADADFVRSVLQAPPRWRDGVQIHQALIAASNPAYLRVRNPNTGAPAGAGPWQEYVLDKMNSLFRRLNVYGYRHYHSFDGWMRKALLGLVDRVLLDPATLARGVFRESTVRRLVGEARQGGIQHDDLLQALVIVELWQRENIGGMN
jgi:asparagine synthase (glutamine-hydrolysing)